MADKQIVTGTQINPDEITMVAAAVKETASKFTYAGINIGSYITDEECRAVAIAAIVASQNFRNAPTI